MLFYQYLKKNIYIYVFLNFVAGPYKWKVKDDN